MTIWRLAVTSFGRFLSVLGMNAAAALPAARCSSFDCEAVKAPCSGLVGARPEAEAASRGDLCGRLRTAIGR